MSLLEASNVCGLTLLRLVSRGNAIVAELLRLSGHIPSVFSDKQETRYKDVVFDFGYCKMPDKFEHRLSMDGGLLDVDHEFQERYVVLVERFYKLFESIYKYYVDYRKFVSDLVIGFYIQHSVEGVLQDVDGSQLFCEALFLYGVMLFLLERRIVGPVRERMIVCYLRCKGETALLNLQQVMTLCAASSSSIYTRFPLDMEVVDMVINKLRTDDIYQLTRSYPLPEHRSTALGTQAGMLYVILMFAPEKLKQGKALMREIVDKFFHDNWVIPVYMGSWVDLKKEWGNPVLPAAFNAMQNGGTVASSEFVDQQKQVNEYLTEGILTDTYLLNHTQAILKTLREANVQIRWGILHQQHQENKQKIVELMLTTAELELDVKSRLKRLLETKHETWELCKGQCAARMRELSQYFTGTVALTRVERDDTLVEWFSRIAAEIDSLEYSNPTLVGRRIQKVIGALQEVEQYNEIDTSLQIKQFLQDARELLLQMVRAVGLREELLSTLDIVSDMSYAWELMPNYMKILHDRIRKAPESVSQLRALFLKLASILDAPLTRITQAGSSDTISVAEYYSSELIRYVRSVLEIIPKTMFDVLLELTSLQTTELHPLPIKLDTFRLGEVASPEARYKLARMTHWISTFTEGVFAMQKTLLGIIEVDPRQILQDGIRKELVKRISNAMEKCNCTNFDTLAKELDGFKRSFEYIQDYIGLNGLKIYQQEYAAIIKSNPPFMQRVRDTLFQQASTGIYAPSWATWFNPITNKECVVSFQKLNNAIGVKGLAGLDRLIATNITENLQHILKLYETTPVLHQIHGEMSMTSLPKQAIFASAVKQYKPMFEKLLLLVVKIGQGQLLRKKLACELNFTSQVHSNLLNSSLLACNKAYVLHMKRNRKILNHKPRQLEQLLDLSGIYDPFTKIYIKTNLCERLPHLLLLLVTHAVSNHLQYDATFDTLTPRKSNVDGVPLAIGLSTILHQFHPDYDKTFKELLQTYVHATLVESNSPQTFVANKLMQLLL